MFKKLKEKAKNAKYTKKELDIRSKFSNGRTIAWICKRYEKDIKDIIKLTKDLK